jgi:hypothetical protein
VYELVVMAVTSIASALAVAAIRAHLRVRQQQRLFHPEHGGAMSRAADPGHPVGGRAPAGPRGSTVSHLGLVARRDPAFSELGFLEEAAELYAKVQRCRGSAAALQEWMSEELAVATSRGGPPAEGVVLGPIQVRAAFADEAWQNAELEFHSRVSESNGLAWRWDRWRLQRRPGGPWRVFGVVDTWRSTFAPPLPDLPLGMLTERPGVAADLDAALAESPDLDPAALRATTETLLAAVLEGRERGLAPLARALDHDAALLQAHGRSRSVGVLRATCGAPARFSRDAMHRVITFHCSVELALSEDVKREGACAFTLAEVEARWQPLALVWSEA